MFEEHSPLVWLELELELADRSDPGCEATKPLAAASSASARAASSLVGATRLSSGS